jgi:hypothetical protein
MVHTEYCSYCNRVRSYQSESTTGFATTQEGEKHCFDCCAVVDRDYMIDKGHSKGLPLYLVQKKEGKWFVTNWPGTLSFWVGTLRKGRHNIAGSRYDVWFNGPDGHVWHGVQYGEWTQVCHCKRTKELID